MLKTIGDKEIEYSVNIQGVQRTFETFITSRIIFYDIIKISSTVMMKNHGNAKYLGALRNSETQF